MSDIRVTYSGLIAFAVGIGSLLTGMMFVLIITRRLTPEEFGIWSLIGSIISYFLISEMIISFWSTRQIARKKEIGKTVVTSSLILSIALIPVYLIYVFAISETSSIDIEIMIFGVILLPTQFLSKAITGINLAHRPQVVSYGIIIFETIKIPIALAFVVVYELGVQGAIIAVFLAILVRIGIQLYFARNKLKNQFSFVTLKNWFKISWVVIYSNLTSYVWKIDAVLFIVITNSVIGLAYYHASLIIANIITNSGAISQGLYPKLLSNGSYDYVKENFTRTMYFAIPLLAITIIFSKPVLFALNPLYQDAGIIVILLALRLFFHMPNAIFVVFLKGIEKVDVNENPKFKNLIKSYLFSISTVSLIQSIIYLSVMVIGLLILTMGSDKEFVIWWAFSALISEIPFTFYWWFKTQKHIKFPFPAIEITKYCLASVAFVIVYFLTSEFIIKYQISIYDFLPGLIIQFMICAATYIAITYLIDKKSRNLIKAIMNEIISRSK